MQQLRSAPEVDERPAVPSRTPKGRAWRNGQRWSRWLHTYTSMIALAVVLFFAVTGVTLNHQDWTFGLDPVSTTEAGTLPADAVSDDGTVDFLAISEWLRDAYDVGGDVSDYGIDGTSGYISYRGPGYSADVFFESDTGAFDLSTEEESIVGVFNDLHKGRDTVSSWNWLIDASGIFLIVIAVSGLALQLFLSKRRNLALAVAAAGAVITVGFTIAAIM